MKTCFKCGESKPTTGFYRHPSSGDGLLGKCKECTKKDTRENRAKNIDYYLEYDKARANLPKRVEARKLYSSTEDGRRSIRKAKEKWIELNTVKRSAHFIVRRALKRGTLFKPSVCSVCGSGGIIHGHHSDYSKPLDVMWMCSKCHSAWHKENGTVDI